MPRIVLVQLGVMMLAAIGFSQLLAGSPDDDSNAAVFPERTLLGVVTVSVLLAFAAPFVWTDYTAPLGLIWIGPGLILMATMLVRFAAHGSRWAVCALVIVAACDLFFYGMSYAVYRTPQTLDRFIAATPTPPAEAPARVVLDGASTTHRGIRAGNRLLLAGYSRADGYAGLEPTRVLDYRTLPAQRMLRARIGRERTLIGCRERRAVKQHGKRYTIQCRVRES